jgi:hypothetical protein
LEINGNVVIRGDTILKEENGHLIILGALIVLAFIILSVMLVYGPGSPGWNYAASHTPVDNWSFCGSYYEDVAVADKYPGTVKVNGKQLPALLIRGSDGIERETFEDIYEFMKPGTRYHVVSFDDSCGRMDHRVIILGVFV